MKNQGWKHIILLAAVAMMSTMTAETVRARQNIVIGAVSVRYDHQDRTYDNNGSAVAVADGSAGDVVAQGVGNATADNGPRVFVLEDRTGDRRDYSLTPRITFSSAGINDVVRLTYAPGVRYDHIAETTDLNHDCGLHLEKRFTRNWLVTLNNHFFLGEDPLRNEELRTADIQGAGEGSAPPVPAVGSPPPEPDQTLTERFGRRRYWTNTMDANSEYTYGEDRLLRLGYTFDVLRNDDGDIGGYTDYDRHTGDLLLHHRLDRKWSGEGEIGYTRGLFDEPNILIGDQAQREAVVIDSDDVKEYKARLRGIYDISSYSHLFTEYSYLGTDYDSSLRVDSDIHNLALGVNYDISQHLHVTMSGGPSWLVRDNSPTETDYNAYGSVTRDFLHGTATMFAEKSYAQDNFDGRGSGLTDSWDIGVNLDYQLTRDLTATLFATYTHDQRKQLPLSQTVILVDQDQSVSTEPDQFEYTEKDYEAGFSLAYTFLRWYTFTSGYRYYNHDSELMTTNGTDSYHEHRAYIELAVSKDLFRW